MQYFDIVVKKEFSAVPLMRFSMTLTAFSLAYEVPTVECGIVEKPEGT